MGYVVTEDTKYSIIRKKCKIVNQTDDSIVSLMGLGLSTLGLANITYLSNLQTFCNPLYLYEQQWLLCYQSNYMNIFSSHSRSTAFIKDQYFSFLETNNVSFFDISIPASIPKRSKIPPSYSSFANGGY
jgi:hypothetical protein